MIVTATPPYFDGLPDGRSRAYQAMRPYIANVMSEFRLIRHTHTLVVVQHCVTCVTHAHHEALLARPDVILVSPLMHFYPEDANIAMMTLQPPHLQEGDAWKDAAKDTVHFVVNWRDTIQNAIARVR